MRNYHQLSSSLQTTLRQCMPASRAQVARMSELGEAILLAGEVALTRIARFLPHQTQQNSRVRWIQRQFDAPFMQTEHLYPPFIRQILQGVTERVWHVVIDRTNLWDAELDLATISLNFRKRAIPLVWCFVPFGGAPLSIYIALLQQASLLVPPGVSVIFHGDTEFGGADMIMALRELGWDFILAQTSATHVYLAQQPTSLPLSSLDVPRTGTISHAGIQLFARQRIARLNLLAFYQPHHARGRRKREICYLATSLPITPGLRRLGRRRWGTEAFYRDFKSSGWNITLSQLNDPQRQQALLLMLAILYVWITVCGRWLCKAGRRREVDAKAKRQRHLSLFRIGWDWLIHHWRCSKPIPIFTTLYS